MNRSTLAIAAMIVAVFCAAVPIWGQTQAQLSGTITDNTGAVVPAAGVQLRNASTGAILD